MIWWLKYAIWNEYHRFCHTAYNSYTGHLVCIDEGSTFLYDKYADARTIEKHIHIDLLDAKGR